MGITNLELPFPPSLNHYWRSVVMGRSARVLTGRLSVRVDLSPPDRRKRDLDNYAKGLLDALTHAGVWADDEQIDRLVLARGAVCKGGRAVVAIEEVRNMALKCPACGHVPTREPLKTDTGKYECPRCGARRYELEWYHKAQAGGE